MAASPDQEKPETVNHLREQADPPAPVRLYPGPIPATAMTELSNWAAEHLNIGAQAGFLGQIRADEVSFSPESESSVSSGSESIPGSGAKQTMQGTEQPGQEANQTGQGANQTRQEANQPGQRQATVTGIEYSAYEDMAEKALQTIRTTAMETFGLEALFIWHSIGLVRTGELSLLIWIASKHRRPALDALNVVVEKIKYEVPIWKKEMLEGGTHRWVPNPQPESPTPKT